MVYSPYWSVCIYDFREGWKLGVGCKMSNCSLSWDWKLVSIRWCKLFFLICLLKIFLSIFYWLYYNCPNISPFPPLCPVLPLPPAVTLPYFISMDHAYKFFGFSISYVLNIPLCILYLPIMVFNPCTFSPFSPLPLPTDNPSNDLHTYDSVSVLVVCLVFCFFKI